MLDVLVLAIVLCGVSWLPVVLFLVNKVRNPESELPVIFHAFWVCGSLGIAITLIQYGFVNALFSFLSPLLVLVYSAYVALQAGLYAALLTAFALFIAFILLASRVHGVPRYWVSIGAIVAILLLPILVQSPIANQKIVRAFEEMNGDCLSYRSFWKSVIYNGRYQESHAVMFRGVEVFVWSYTNQQFINVNESRYLPGYIVPNDDCSRRDW